MRFSELDYQSRIEIARILSEKYIERMLFTSKVRDVNFYSYKSSGAVFLDFNLNPIVSNKRVIDHFIKIEIWPIGELVLYAESKYYFKIEKGGIGNLMKERIEQYRYDLNLGVRGIPSLMKTDYLNVKASPDINRGFIMVRMRVRRLFFIFDSKKLTGFFDDDFITNLINGTVERVNVIDEKVYPVVKKIIDVYGQHI